MANGLRVGALFGMFFGIVFTLGMDAHALISIPLGLFVVNSFIAFVEHKQTKRNIEKAKNNERLS